MGAWANTYKRSLKEMRPTLYAQMKADGTLEAAALEAEENAMQLTADLTGAMSPTEAQNTAIRQYLLWPDEKEVPDLLQNPYQTN